MIIRSTNFSWAVERTPDSSKGELLFKRAYPLLASTAFNGQQLAPPREAAPANLF